MGGSQVSRRQLAAKALVRLTVGFPIVLGVFLQSAGTMAYWEAWAYLAILYPPAVLVVAYLLRHDPELLERRMRTKEKEAAQGRIIKLGSLCYTLVFLLPGCDRRFDWSHVPIIAVVVADVSVLVG
jgi:hypothetical protein